MKIAIVDNMCNTGYVLMRYLVDAGYDVELLLMRPVTDYDGPECDTHNKQYFDRIKTNLLEEKGILRRPATYFRKVFDAYDFVIGSSLTPLMFYRMRRTVDVFMPHGPDIFMSAFHDPMRNPFSRDNFYRKLLARWQFRGIQDYTKHILFELTNDYNESFLKRFPKAKFQRHYLTPPLLYTPQYSSPEHEAYRDSSIQAARVKALKEAGNTIVFHHCQQQWKNPWHNLFNKGNQMLVQGLKMFKENFPDYPIKVVMTERGTDILATKALLKELNLEDSVMWIPSIHRKEIMACLHYADLGIGELQHSWYTYNVMAEFLTMGVPLIHNCNQEYYRGVHENMYPMYHASSAEDVATLLARYATDPMPFRATGLAGQQWLQEGLVEPVLDLIAGWIDAKSTDPKKQEMTPKKRPAF